MRCMLAPSDASTAEASQILCAAFYKKLVTMQYRIPCIIILLDCAVDVERQLCFHVRGACFSNPFFRRFEGNARLRGAIVFVSCAKVYVSACVCA